MKITTAIFCCLVLAAMAAAIIAGLSDGNFELADYHEYANEQ